MKGRLKTALVIAVGIPGVIVVILLILGALLSPWIELFCWPGAQRAGCQ